MLSYLADCLTGKALVTLSDIQLLSIRNDILNYLFGNGMVYEYCNLFIKQGQKSKDRLVCMLKLNVDQFLKAISVCFEDNTFILTNISPQTIYDAITDCTAS